jgi:hypothetical protein
MASRNDNAQIRSRQFAASLERKRNSMPLVALLLMAAFYFVIGPLLLLIAIRIFLWLARMFDLSNAVGVFSAEIHRSFLAHARALDREFGTGVNQRAE